jgi:hypothetical protein
MSNTGYEIRKRWRVWMAVRKRCGLSKNERTDLRKIAGDEVIVIDLTNREDNTIKVVNIDDQRTRETGERPAMRQDWKKVIRQGGGSTVLTGDLNAHSQCWDLRCTEWREAIYWDATIDKHRLVIGHDD